MVRVVTNLYVRSVHGHGSDWFRGVLTQHAGRIQAGGVEKDVTFHEEIDPPLDAQNVAAYGQKYSHHPKEYVDARVTPEARSVTIKLKPRLTGS